MFSRLLKYVVDLLGFEPRKPEPKTGVLPLHHRSILIECKIKRLRCNYQTLIQNN